MTKKIKNTSTLKDLNLQKIKKQNQLINNDFIKFKPDDIEQIKDQIKKDVELFKRFNLMDYSLLFAIEKVGSYSDKSKAEGKSESFS